MEEEQPSKNFLRKDILKILHHYEVKNKLYEVLELEEEVNSRRNFLSLQIAVILGVLEFKDDYNSWNFGGLKMTVILGVFIV